MSEPRTIDVGGNQGRSWRFLDLRGQRFGRLAVVSLAQRGPTRWNCTCDCGSAHVVSSHDLRDGSSTSCGCWKRESATTRATTHGMKNTSVYKIWKGMRDRCTRTSNKSYAMYGGRGITVCERWQAFGAFYEDMGDRPSSRQSIDRIDNSKGYEPGNCRWATASEQSSNTRRTILIDYAGKSQCIAAWAREIGVSHECLRRRIKHGWPLDRALSPLGSKA